MRIGVLFGAIFSSALTIGAANAGDDCCIGAPFPHVVYALPPAPFAVPPTGYVLDPSDAAKPYYIVNQGTRGFGILNLARPTYSEGGYAFADSYPHVHSYGYGNYFGYRAWPVRPHRVGFVRPFGVPPYTAYRYRLAPSAHIIHIQQGG